MISIDSMFSGLMSATVHGIVLGVANAASEIAPRPLEIRLLEYTAVNHVERVERAENRVVSADLHLDAAAPGAEFDCRFTPLTRPSAFWIVAAGTLVIASPVTWATAVVALRRSIVVACPVTTTPSICSTSRSSAKFAVVWFAAITCIPRLYPRPRAIRVTCPSGTVNRYVPSSLDRVSAFVPSAVTLAPAIGTELPATVTVPVITRVWAHANCGNVTAIARVRIRLRLCTRPPVLR
jgi:hypothetical protein